MHKYIIAIAIIVVIAYLYYYPPAWAVSMGLPNALPHTASIVTTAPVVATIPAGVALAPISTNVSATGPAGASASNAVSTTQ